MKKTPILIRDDSKCFKAKRASECNTARVPTVRQDDPQGRSLGSLQLLVNAARRAPIQEAQDSLGDDGFVAYGPSLLPQK